MSRAALTALCNWLAFLVFGSKEKRGLSGRQTSLFKTNTLDDWCRPSNVSEVIKDIGWVVSVVGYITWCDWNVLFLRINGCFRTDKLATLFVIYTIGTVHMHTVIRPFTKSYIQVEQCTANIFMIIRSNCWMFSFNFINN